ncbi:MBOAT family protein [Lentimicrobium sp. S6]|uniref:MBOAT family O-acyltransferase n=1 Tax=Lentimicrobium sp. S6 TaxID=2735872 RepID=UPI001551C22A|nr:MBOAT family protein [Lentimicrobium sp. S6]NPD46738.1 MBOAT family protein [Lentimicrobium sp. S6]
MLFNSYEFIVFIILTFLVYWFVVNKSIKLQNLFLLGISYVFYGWWDWRFLSLILFSSLLDYFIGLRLQKEKKPKPRKLLLILSLVVNLGFLGYFKYYNFFVTEFVEAFSFFGFYLDIKTLNIILPVGISFYTFQTLSYSIDVYRGKLKATKDLISFMAYVSFFPQLVAGPIERAVNLLPQFHVKRVFDLNLAKDGMRQILWGLFKKVVIADGAASTVNLVFNQYDQLPASTILIGVIFFAFQIYGDFSGYSDIAIGVGKLFGFKLMRNFAYPYFSRDIAEFWRRWHISLSTWFRDYVYIPLGGSKGNNYKRIRNTFIIFGVSGFWHGANWTFIVWGLLNALYFLPLMLTNKNRKNTNIVAENSILPSLKELLQILLTFTLTLFAWIFFRSDSVTQAIDIIGSIFSPSILDTPVNIGSKFYILIIVFVIIEWIQRRKEFGLDLSNVKSRIVRWGVYFIISILVFYFFNYQQSFIYFQF